nr:hypothetical protein [uncultured Gellertiella sp.]
MFYFGGMTLGYLTPAPVEGKGNCGDGVAGNGEAKHQGSRTARCLPSLKELRDRANWFSFYW